MNLEKFTQQKIATVDVYFAENFKEYLLIKEEKSIKFDFVFKDVILLSNNDKLAGSIILKADYVEADGIECTYKMFLYVGGKILGKVLYLNAKGNKEFNLKGNYIIKKNILFVSITEDCEKNGKSDNYIFEVAYKKK